MSLALRSFSFADQKRFAFASGDHNPMHIDALHARRTQAGAPVVHGVNLLLWALDSLAAAQPDLPQLRSLRAHFNQLVYLDQNVEVVLIQQKSTGARLSITVDGASRLKISLEFGEMAEDCPSWSTDSLESVPILQVPLNPNFEQMAGLSGRFPFQMTPQDTLALFPAATKWIGTTRIAALAASTCLVGMVCPGLHSIYSELTICACAESDFQDSLAFRVTETDPRFLLVEEEIAGGGLSGKVKSIVRTPPAQQATMDSLAGVVDSSEFAGSVALIVGGSRGLGELTAKLIAAGGGRVLITWHTGKDDAERVAHEIREAGGSCETFAYDARRPAIEQLSMLADAPTHAYYFATPSIFRPQAGMFAPERLQEYLSIYVEGFWQMVQALRVRQPGISIFYPSSVSVTKRPRGMTEYTMAKAAGEVLCADMNESLAPLHVTVKRLPRLPTDQTASIAAVETARPLEIMLPIIREVQSWLR